MTRLSDINSGGTKEGKETTKLLKTVSNTQNKGHELKMWKGCATKEQRWKSREAKIKQVRWESNSVSRIKKKSWMRILTSEKHETCTSLAK